MTLSSYFQNRTFEHESSRKNIALYFLTGLFYDGLFEFFTLFVLLYVQQASPIIHESPETYSVMFSAVTWSLVAIKVLAAFVWTLAGHLLESKTYRYGRYRTFFFYGAVFTSFFFVLMFYFAPLFSGWVYVSLFLVFFFLMEASFAFNDVAFWAYLNTVSENEQRKSKISALLTFFTAFGSYAVAAVSPAISTGNAERNMKILGAVMVSTFFLSLVFFSLRMEERRENPIPREDSSGPFEPFRIFFTDRQVRLSMIVFFFLFLAQDCLIGNSTDYFYYMYGYGSFGDPAYGSAFQTGGVVSFFFTLAFGIGNCLSELFYPLLNKRLNKRQILFVAFPGVLATYLTLFFFGLLPGRVNEMTLYVTTGLLAFFHGLLFTVFFVNVLDCSTYYEAKTGKERNGSLQSLRNFSLLIANAVQTGIFAGTLSLTHLDGINAKVAGFEALRATGGYASGELSFVDQVNGVIHEDPSSLLSGLAGYRASLTLLPLILSFLATALTLLFVKVNKESEVARYQEAVLSHRKQEKSVITHKSVISP